MSPRATVFSESPEWWSERDTRVNRPIFPGGPHGVVADSRRCGWSVLSALQRSVGPGGFPVVSRSNKVDWRSATGSRVANLPDSSRLCQVEYCWGSQARMSSRFRQWSWSRSCLSSWCSVSKAVRSGSVGLAFFHFLLAGRRRSMWTCKARLSIRGPHCASRASASGVVASGKPFAGRNLGTRSDVVSHKYRCAHLH
jgi:hypothetical protein